MRPATLLPVLVSLLLATGCGAGGDGPQFSRELQPWPEGPPPPSSGLFTGHGLDAFDPWTGQSDWNWVAGEVEVRHDRLGYFGIGNGRVFSLVGTDYPLSVLHEACGPDYEREGGRSFPDIVFSAFADGAPVRFSRSRIGRLVRNGAVGVTAEGQGLKLSSLFFAPVSETGPFTASIVVLVRLENTGSRPLTAVQPAALPHGGAAVTGSVGVAAVRQGDRTLWIALEGGSHDALRDGLLGTAADLQPGAVRDATFALFFTDGEAADDPAPRFLEAARTADAGTLLQAVGAHWEAVFAAGAQFSLPDRRVAGLLETFLHTIAIQTPHNGALSPMSHYGEFWTRDISGPVRFHLAAGRPDDAARILDYHHAAACRKGGFFNAADTDLPVGGACEVADWSALPPMTGRTAAEGPSYIPHLYHAYFNATGDDTRLRDRLPMLRHALQKQAFGPDRLLPFSDDETYRPAMAINTGVGDANYAWSEHAWSLQSSLLFAAASDGLVRALGLPAGDPLALLRDEVVASIGRNYWNEPDGYFAPFLLIETQEPYPHPYEDVNLTAAWLQLEPLLGAGRVRRDIDRLVAEAWRPEKGMIQTWRGEPVDMLGYSITEGIATGMTPGFALYALARHRPDLAGAAFDAFPRFITSSGEATEDFSIADLAPLMPIYDRTGGIGELWARFRPWEGGLDGEALLHFLTGLEADSAARSVRLAPRLPDNWPAAGYSGLLAAGCTIDLEVAEQSDTRRRHRLNFTGTACPGLEVTLRAATWACGERDECAPAVTVSRAGRAVADGSGSGTFRVTETGEYLVEARSE